MNLGFILLEVGFFINIILSLLDVILEFIEIE